MNTFYSNLIKSQLEGHIGQYYALTYADDLTLISPSPQELSQMLQICQSFADDYNITFNVKKTVCIKKVCLNGSVIKW